VSGMPDNIFAAMVKLHTFTLQRRVKTAGGLLYVTGAVLTTLWHTQARVLGQMPGLQQAKTLMAGVVGAFNQFHGTIIQVIQQAQGLFR